MTLSGPGGYSRQALRMSPEQLELHTLTSKDKSRGVTLSPRTGNGEEGWELSFLDCLQ